MQQLTVKLAAMEAENAALKNSSEARARDLEVSEVEILELRGELQKQQQDSQQELQRTSDRATAAAVFCGRQSRHLARQGPVGT